MAIRLSKECTLLMICIVSEGYKVVSMLNHRFEYIDVITI